MTISKKVPGTKAALSEMEKKQATIYSCTDYINICSIYAKHIITRNQGEKYMLEAKKQGEQR